MKIDANCAIIYDQRHDNDDASCDKRKESMNSLKQNREEEKIFH